jgi:hypothetical protein
LASLVKQHYIPKFYLKGFTDPSARRYHNAPLWYWPLAENAPRWRQERPKNIARRPDYFTFKTGPEQGRLGLELFLQDVENEAAAVIRSIATLKFPDSSDAKAHLAVFVATMMGRVPSHVEKMGKFYVATILNAMRSRYRRFRDHPEEIEPFVEQMRKDGFDAKGLKTADDFNPDRFKATIDSAWVAASLIGGALNLSTMIGEMSWILFVTEESRPFITSDSPVCLFDPSGARPVGLTNIEVQISLPLTRAICLLAHRSGTKDEIRFEPMVDRDVCAVNLRTRRNAEIFLAASSRSFPGREELLVVGEPG